MQLLLLNTNKTYASLELCAIIVLIVIHYGTKKLRTAFLLLKHDSCFISMICAKAWKKEWNLEVLREISFSLSPLKQKRWLNRFCSFTVCHVVTLHVRISWSKIQKQLNLKSRFSAQYAYKRYLKNNSFEAQKSSGRPPKLSKKNQKKKIITDVLKDPKTSLERIWVAHNAFSCNKTISRG